MAVVFVIGVVVVVVFIVIVIVILIVAVLGCGCSFYGCFSILMVVIITVLLRFCWANLQASVNTWSSSYSKARESERAEQELVSRSLFITKTATRTVGHTCCLL